MPTTSMSMDPTKLQSLLLFGEKGKDMRQATREQQDAFVDAWVKKEGSKVVRADLAEFLKQVKGLTFKPKLGSGTAIMVDYHSALARSMRRYGVKWSTFHGEYWASDVFRPAIRPLKVAKDLEDLVESQRRALAVLVRALDGDPSAFES